MDNASPLIGTGAVAKRRGVTSTTVRQWVADGLIKPAIITQGGHYRFFAADFPIPEPHGDDAA